MEMPMAISKTNCYHAMMAMLRRTTLAPQPLEDVYCPGFGTGVGQVLPCDAAEEMAAAYCDWQKKFHEVKNTPVHTE
jgi:O-acetyl-ADP-ribose deacetylase (regulator of RNase III)